MKNSLQLKVIPKQVRYSHSTNVLFELEPKKPVVEEENLEQQLAECEAELENLDPSKLLHVNFLTPFLVFSKTKAFEPQLETRELFPQDAPELELNSDLIKGPEVLLQPSIVGVDQPGLSETILFVISRYDEATQRALFGNICLIVPIYNMRTVLTSS